MERYGVKPGMMLAVVDGVDLSDHNPPHVIHRLMMKSQRSRILVFCDHRVPAGFAVIASRTMRQMRMVMKLHIGGCAGLKSKIGVPDLSPYVEIKVFKMQRGLQRDKRRGVIFKCVTHKKKHTSSPRFDESFDLPEIDLSEACLRPVIKSGAAYERHRRLQCSPF